MFGRVLNRLKFLKQRLEGCERKQGIYKLDERNAGTWVKHLSFVYSRQGTEKSVHNIIMNQSPAKVLSSEFCKIFKITLFIEYLGVTAFKESELL